MVAAVRFGEFSELLILAVKFLVAVGILIQRKLRAGKEAHKGVFVRVLHSRGLRHSLGLDDLHAASDQGIVHADRDHLIVRADIYVMSFRAYGIKCGSFDFRHNEMTIRNVLKGKCAVFSRSAGHDRRIFGKALRVRSEKTHQGAGKLLRLAAVRRLTVLDSLDPAAQQVVFNRLSFVHMNHDDRRILSRIGKLNRIGHIRNHIRGVGGALLDVVASERKVRCKDSGEVSVLVRNDGNGFQKPVLRDHRTVHSDKFLCGIETKGYILVFFAVADLEQLVFFHSLCQIKSRLLALVIKADGLLRDLNGLARIGELHIFRLFVQHAAIRSLAFLQTVFPKIEKSALRDPIIPGGERFHNRILFHAQGAVAGINILVGDQVIGRARKPLDLIDRLIQAFVFLNGEEYLAGFGNRDLSLLGHVVLGHSNDRLAAVNGERDRLAGEHIAVRRSHLVKLVVSIRQNFRQHEPAFVRHIESIQRFWVRIVDFLFDKFAGGEVFDLKARSGERDDISGFGVPLFHLDPCRNRRVIEDIAVGLSALGDKDGKVRHQRLTFIAGYLVYGIAAIRQIL